MSRGAGPAVRFPGDVEVRRVAPAPEALLVLFDAAPEMRAGHREGTHLVAVTQKQPRFSRVYFVHASVRSEMTGTRFGSPSFKWEACDANPFVAGSPCF